MQEAIRLAVENVAKGGGPFGCVVVLDGKIIGRGVNRVTTDHDPSAHAEVVAIRDACNHLSDHQLVGCELYCSCEPCPMCLGAIYWARPSAVFFSSTRQDAAAAGFDDLFIYDELSRPTDQRSIAMHQIDGPAGAAAFHAWREKPDRTPY